jgi:ribonuclease J
MGSDVGATKNMVVYEYGDDIIVVDCGVGFPDAETLGVDVVIPDITYLLENKEKVRAIFVTHVHEDHFGAIPYIIEDLPVPIYTNRIAIEFIKGRLKDKGVKNYESFVNLI